MRTISYVLAGLGIICSAFNYKIGNVMAGPALFAIAVVLFLISDFKKAKK